MIRPVLLPLLALAVLAHPARAAEPGPPASAVRAQGEVTLDGRLDEATWQAAPVLDRFVEYYPGDLTPPTERTEVRFLYDDRYLYVGFRLSLREVDKLRKPFVRRDKVGGTHDYVQVYLDPQGSGRNGYMFRVNARGVKTDGLNDEAKQSETLDPDYDWDAATSIDAGGWTAEMRIPLSTLRITRTGPQGWLMVVTRGVPRGQYAIISTARFPKNASCFYCYASPLELPDLTPKTETLIVTPSVTGTARRDEGAAGSGDHSRGQVSLDLKWLAYPGGVVDLAIKPDFSQVEADAPQLTGNLRFAPNLPEKRPFFREGLDLVSTQIPAFYTRTVLAPDLGLRFTQRSAGFNATAFLARDVGKPAILEPGLLQSRLAFPDFDSTVAFGHGKWVRGAADAGLLFAAKRNDDGSSNSVAGFDASWGDATDRAAGQVLGSWTRDPNRPDLIADWHGQSLAGTALALRWDHTAETLWTVKYNLYSEGFRSWLGYAPRVGYQEGLVDLRRPLYPRGWIVNDVTPYVTYDRLAPLNRGGGEQDLALGFTSYGVRNLSVDVSVHPDTRVLTRQGDERRTRTLQWTISAVPAGRVPQVATTGTVGTMIDFATGEVVDGSTLSLRLRTRPLDRLELEAWWSRNRLGDAPGGGTRLDETAGELMATWYFGPAFYAMADYQTYRGRRTWPAADRFSSSLASLQFAWEARPDLQLFWGARSGAERPDDPADRGRSTEVYFKVSRTIRTGRGD
ncbi:hypothetical protein QO010_003429 [Caulobacter ginsengisoli]|uniref:Carbohydrate-binding domain-containing protein n=1 Tax=Caulobacter ginsengisoli TaxID=400775 RepID=A0ABU0IUF1_9CAUL|nr:sugar-binding protein [Caulobacter ginsengisoli]MDQ0465640.1 hypothetical protein [Caulobacter ginsengisoli]